MAKRRTHEERLRDELLAKMPTLDDAEKRKLNALFQPYIFRRSKTRELWTSCCGKHVRLDRRGETDAEFEIMRAAHCPEPKHTWFTYVNEEAAEERVRCPYCGAEAKLKELGRTGNRKNLWQYRRAIALKADKRGRLWARAYNMTKYYEGGGALNYKNLCALPKMQLLGVYRCQIGSAVGISRSWYFADAQFPRADEANDGLISRKHWLSDPFTCCTEYGTCYDVIGGEEIGKSVLRYCGIAAENGVRDKLIEELNACAVYPRQIEMLRKMGMGDFVSDLVTRCVKNADVFRWDAATPTEMLGLSKAEIKDFAEHGGKPTLLRVYKRINKDGKKADMADAEELWEITQYWRENERASLWRLLRSAPLPVKKIVKYLREQKDRKNNKTLNVGITWRDYLAAAEAIGWDLKNPLIFCPRDLKRKHDEATKAHNAILRAEEQRRNAEMRKEMSRLEKKRLKQLAVKYTYTDGRYLIRPPIDAAEIVAEGKALVHCVGGYADRHVNGKTTILFLRDRRRPGVPLATIEINGTNIVQIHGYRNEWQPCQENPEKKPLTELHADFLAGWLAWVKAGSKRPKKKKTKKAASAA